MSGVIINDDYPIQYMENEGESPNPKELAEIDCLNHTERAIEINLEKLKSCYVYKIFK